jgi:hypothetical protein
MFNVIWVALELHAPEAETGAERPHQPHHSAVQPGPDSAGAMVS